MLSRDIKEILARVTVAATGRAKAAWWGGGGGGGRPWRGLTSGYCVNGRAFIPVPSPLFPILHFMYNFPKTQSRPPLPLLLQRRVVTLQPLACSLLSSAAPELS